jgi:hypothetical protein
MALSLKIRARVIAGRVVLEVDDEPPTILGRVISCPCCGAPAAFVEAPPCPR